MQHLSAYLDEAAQQALVAEIRALVTKAPLFTPTMPAGDALSLCA